MLGSRRSAPRLLLVLGVVAVAVGRVVGPAGRLVRGPHRELFRRKVDVALGRFGHELVLVVRDVVIDEKGMLIWPALLAPVAPELLIERSRLPEFLAPRAGGGDRSAQGCWSSGGGSGSSSAVSRSSGTAGAFIPEICRSRSSSA